MVDISNLEGLTGKIGKEDINFGSGLVSDTFSVPTSLGSTQTLTKVPALAGSSYSIIKEMAYAQTSGITDHGTILYPGSIAYLISLGYKNITVPAGSYPVLTGFQVPSDVKIYVDAGAIITPAAGITVTINGEIVAAFNQVFDLSAASSSVVFGDFATARVEWFKLASESTFENAFTRAIDSGAKTIMGEASAYLVNNAAPIDIDRNNLRLVFQTGTTITCQGTGTLFNITGKNILFEGGKLVGNGTYLDSIGAGTTPGNYAGLIRVYNATPTEVQKVSISNVHFKNASNTCIACYRTVDVNITGCTFESAYVKGANLKGISAVYAYSSSYIKVCHNDFYGFEEGVLAGAVTTYPYNDFHGVTDWKTRNIIISDNSFSGFQDHAVYTSNECEYSIVADNMAVNVTLNNQPIKIEGGYNSVSGNVIKSGQGIALRSPYNTVIANNTITCTSDADNSGGILVEGYEAFDRNIESLLISNNVIDCIGHMVWGIRVYSKQRTSDGTQNLIKNITIANNIIDGFGDYDQAGAGASSQSAGIVVLQDPDAIAANSLYGENINITGNTIRVVGAAAPNQTYGIDMRGGAYSSFKNSCIEGNNIEGAYYGMLISLKDSIVGTNRINSTSNPIFEQDNANIPIGNNYYAFQAFLGYESLISLKEDNTIDFQFMKYLNPLAGSLTVYAYNVIYDIVVNPNAAGYTITPSIAGSSIWPKYKIITITNLSAAQTVAFDPLGINVTIATTSTERFMCVGSNVFIHLPV